MSRFRDVALVASLFSAGPVLAGTSLAKSEGMVTPALSCTAPPATGEVPSTPTAGGAQGLFEALIADFRWGQPEMGGTAYLPVPPPYRMRAEEGSEGGDEAPLGGNSGNPLPPHFAHLPLPPPTDVVKLPEVAPTPAPVVAGRLPGSDVPVNAAITRTLAGANESIACSTTGGQNEPSGVQNSPPANITSQPVAGDDHAALDSLMRQLTSALL